MKKIKNKILSVLLAFATCLCLGGAVWSAFDFSFENTKIEANAATSVTVAASDVSSHTATATSGMYFKATANDAPYDGGWGLRYTPTSADAVTFTRNGVTTNVGNTGAETIVKYTETEYFIESWTVGVGSNGWQVGDIYTLNGSFYNATNDATITFNNVQLQVVAVAQVEVTNNDVTEIKDAPTVIAGSVYEAGQMYANANTGSSSSTGIYLSTIAVGDAPYNSDWSVEYKPFSAGNIKIARGGETLSVANTEAGTVVKMSDRDYYLKFDSWMNGNFPLQDGDVVTVSGLFYKDNTYINFAETVITYSGGAFTFSTDFSSVAKPMSSHTNGGSDTGFYYTMEDNGAAYDSNWSVEYVPTSADNVKLTRGSETVSVGNTGAGTIVKISATDYYFKTEAWMNSTYFPLQDGDVLTISGAFVGNTFKRVTLNITETIVTYSGGVFTFSTPTVHEAGQMYAHESGIGNNADSEFAFYFKTDANDAMHGGYDGDDDGWDVEYGATSVDNIKLTRNGETTSVAVVGQGTIVRLNEIDHYMKFASHTVSNVLPVQEGDVFTISGTFKCTSDATQMFNITETTVTYANGALQYSTDEVDTAIEAGQMYEHTAGGSGTGFHFIMAENTAPYDEWKIEYAATSADNIKITRNGVTQSVAKADANLLVKFDATGYYIKFEGHTVEAGYTPLQDGDIITVSGEFYNAANDVTIRITETTVEYFMGGFYFSTSATQKPTLIEAGTIKVHPVNGATSDGFYFTMAENAAPYDDWSIRYTPISTDVIKRIRNSETTNVGNTGAETIVKYSDTEYYMEGWAIGNLEEGDMFIVEGYFKNKAENVIIHIEKTTIAYANGKISVIKGFSMLDGASVRLNSSKMGIRFTAEIGATYDADATYHVMIVPNEYLTLLNIKGDYYTQLREKLGESAYIATMEALPFQATAEDAENYGLTEGIYYVRGSLTTIQFNNMNTEFFGIAYSVKDGVYTYASFNEGENVRSLVEISSVALCDESYKDNATLQGFVARGLNKAAGNADSTTYNGTIAISDGELNYIKGYPINAKLTLGLPEGADVVVNWSSSAPDTIAVDDKGNVIGLKTGSATITATCMGKTYTCQVTNQAGARPVGLKLKGKILSWDALAELDAYKVTIGDTTKTVNGTLVDVSDFNLTEDKEYTVSVCGIVGDKETNATSLKFKYNAYGEAYQYADESGETLSVGVWNGSYHFSDAAKIKELADAGYTLILHVNPIMGHDSVESFIAVLDKAYEYGVSMMVDPRSYNATTGAYEQWSGNINEAQTYSGTDKSFTPADYLTHPAIVGVVGWEEPNEDTISTDGLDAIEEAFKASRTGIGREDLEFFVNFLPRWGDNSTDFDGYLDGYADKLDNQQISLDDYALVRNSSDALYIRKSYFETLAVATAKAKAEGVPFWYTLLSCAHQTEDTKYHYTAPTAEEIRWQMAVGMAFGAQNLTHYTYTSHDTENYTSTMVEYGTFEKTALFNTIAGVNAEYRAWDAIYRNYTWQGFKALNFGKTGNSLFNYTTNALMYNLESKTGVEYYDYTKNGLKSVDMTSGNNTDTTHNSKDLLVGTFQDANGNNAFMITNAGSAVNTSSSTNEYYVNLAYENVAFDVKLTFDDGYTGVWVINQGVKEYHDLTDNAYTLNIAAWDGAFVIPVKAQASLDAVTVNGFDKADNSISWNAVTNAYAYDVVITRDGETVVDTVVFDTKLVLDEVVFGAYVVTVTARNDGQYQASSGTGKFTLGLK